MQSNRKKLLLIGRSGSGKSSMRSIIFSNYSAMDTHRLGATIDVEHSHLRFLGNMTLNLWDCGGQNLFIENYLTTQRDHIFRVVEVLIYVFDIGSKEVPKDMETFSRVLGNLQEFSPDAKVFVLLHKMDLVRADRRQQVYDATMTSIRSNAQQFKFNLEGFATSIWDESLYKAWSSIVCSLITNMGNLQQKLSEFVDLTCAREAILFERTTFLVISHIASQKSGQNSDLIGYADPQRFEKISNIVKSYRQSCSKLHSQLQSVTLKSPVGIVVINSLTANTFVMVVLRENTSNVNLVQSNINSARKQFEAIEKQTTASSSIAAKTSN